MFMYTNYTTLSMPERTDLQDHAVAVGRAFAVAIIHEAMGKKGEVGAAASGSCDLAAATGAAVIARGDLVVGDDDGVLAIAAADFTQLRERVQARASREADVDARSSRERSSRRHGDCADQAASRQPSRSDSAPAAA